MQAKGFERSRSGDGAPGLSEMTRPGAGTGEREQTRHRWRTRSRSDADRAELAIFAGMAKDKTYVDEKLGQVTVRKSRQARRISIRVTPDKGVVVTVPYWVPYRVGEAFLMSRRDWAEQALRRMANRVKEALEQGILNQGSETGALEQGTMIPGSEMMPREMGDAKPTDVAKGKDVVEALDAKIERWRKVAKETLPARLAELAGKYGFRYGRVTIKHNRSNWGSCSAKGNINLNLNLVRLPKELQDYVMLHELCHLRHMDHGTEFHRLLEELCRREMRSGEMAADGGRDCNAKEGWDVNVKEAPLHERLRKQLKSYILL